MKAVPLVEIAVTLRLGGAGGGAARADRAPAQDPARRRNADVRRSRRARRVYLALRGGAPSPAPTPLMQAASAYDAVCAALEAMRFTSGERGAVLARDAARASLLELLGVHDVETA